MADYTRYFKLTQRPFVTVPLSTHYLRHTDDPAEGLISAVHQRRGLVVVTGEPGTGKSILARHVLFKLPAATTAATLLVPVQTHPDPDRFVRRLAQQLGSEVDNDPGLTLDALIVHLQAIAEAGRSIAVLLDDAHTLVDTPRVLQQIRGLLNLENSARGGQLLTFVLFGDPSLATHLQSIPGMHERVALHSVLRPWRSIDTRNFVRRRLRAAEAPDGLIGDAVAVRMHDACDGLPRAVAQMCDALLTHMADVHAPEATQALLAEACPAAVPPPIPGAPEEPSISALHPDAGVQTKRAGTDGPDVGEDLQALLERIRSP